MNKSVKRALISVSDKTGLIEFAQGLRQLNIELLSTGGSAKLLAANQIPVTEISDYTGFPEIMGGRVKTLHPKIHGGILQRGEEDHEIMQNHDISPIDLVVVNLYPFQQTINEPGCGLAEAIENIDIGGPTMLRAAAKNHRHVAVICTPDDYSRILDELKQSAGISQQTRFRLAQKVFAHTAFYDAIIAQYLAEQSNAGSNLTEQLSLPLVSVSQLRYGENPQQQAGFYRNPTEPANGLASAELLSGKALSYNNLADADAALNCLKDLAGDSQSCVIVKHANPCGVAQASTLKAAYLRAFATDPVSSFGGIIAASIELDLATAECINQQFAEVVLAPGFSDAAFDLLSLKKNLRLLKINLNDIDKGYALKSIQGGVLIQDKDNRVENPSQYQIVTQKQPSAAQMQDLMFAWKVVKHVKSNAIVYARDAATIGIGAGQMSRVFSAEIAIQKAQAAGLEIAGSVMASDAFFPFKDSVEAAARQGITAIIQPGGSIRDAEVIDCANQHGIAMVFTGIRHFYH